jgi:tubulin-folding cofactor B
VKDRFQKHIGTPPQYQRLILKDQFGNAMCELSDDSRKLGFYSPQSGMEIHVIDTDPYSLSRNGGLTDVSLVEKYKISEEAYDTRKGTMRDYIREQRKTNPNFKLKAASINTTSDDSEQKAPESYDAETVKGIEVGNRCEVQPGARRGTVKFIGEIVLEEKSKGFWVGVQFDEPLGHNNGCFKGVKFFECPDGYGAFVRGNNLTIGDFPERDLLADDDEEDEL